MIKLPDLHTIRDKHLSTSPSLNAAVHISGAQVLMSTENVTMSTRFCVLVLI